VRQECVVSPEGEIVCGRVVQMEGVNDGNPYYRMMQSSVDGWLERAHKIGKSGLHAYDEYRQSSGPWSTGDYILAAVVVLLFMSGTLMKRTPV